MVAYSVSERKQSRARVSLMTFALLALLVVVLFAPVIVQMIIQRTDYTTRVRDAESWALDGTTLRPRPHFLFHTTVALVQAVIPGFEFTSATIVVALALYLFAAIVVYRLVRAAVPVTSAARADALSLAIALGLLTLAPITIPTWSSRNLYFGYIVTSAYHNPTIVMMKPLALLVFAYAADLLIHPNKGVSGWTLAAAALVTVACVVAKPSYIICALPALGLVYAYKFSRRERIPWLPVIAGIALPAALALVYQYYFFRTDLGGGFAFAPFRFMNYYTSNLLPKFLLSIAFPAAVYVLNWNEARRDTVFNFAWISFFTGAFYTYFLIEVNDWTSGNFIWSAQATLFMVFVYATLFFLRTLVTPQPASRWQRIFLVVLFALHLVSGVFWYYVHVTGQFTINNIGLPSGWW